MTSILNITFKLPEAHIDTVHDPFLWMLVLKWNINTTQSFPIPISVFKELYITSVLLKSARPHPAIYHLAAAESVL